MNFTLIIPVAPGRNAEILESIKNIDYPESAFEVVVSRGANPSANRNEGARRAKGEIIAFLDDDAVIPDNYLKEAEAFFIKHPDIDIVGGPQLTAKDDKFFPRISGYALSSNFGTWKVSTRYSGRKISLNVDETAVSSANLLCRKEVMERVVFDAKFYPGEDPRFIADAKKAGFMVAYTPAIRLYHRRRPTIGTLMKQIYGYGKARPQKETICETMSMPFFFVPSLFLIYLVSLTAVIVVIPHIVREAVSGTLSGWQAVFLPLVLYIISAFFSGIYDSVKNNDYKAMVFLPVVYPAIHLSYGWGMIMGYLKKYINGK